MYLHAVLMVVAATNKAAGNMNPVEYEIANPPPGHESLRQHRGEFFEMLGPVKKSQYSEVNWHSGSTSLPEEIIQRFDGKVIAITGYEVDIIRKDAEGKETSVPCYELYNHHYSGWMHGKAMQRRHDEVTNFQVGSHGTPLPQWGRVAEVPRTQNCDINGIWLNPSNKIRVNITTGASDSTYKCTVCGHTYDPDKDGNGVPFEQLPDTWVCPVCGAPKSKYQKTVSKGGRVHWVHEHDEKESFNASCIGPKGWHRGYGTVTAPSVAQPQGGAVLFVADDPGADTHGVFSSANNGQCSKLSWADGNVWYREPYTPDAPTDFPTVQAFSEGNGNEHRVSFKGYAKGYAQLVHSPVAFVNSPMIINLNKRLTGESTPGVVASLQPRLSIAPRGPGAKYNGVLECPCTTRKVKIVDRYFSRAQHACPPVTIEATSVPSRVSTLAECQAAAAKTLHRKTVDVTAVNSSALPPGCSYSGSAVTFNNNSESAVECASGQQCLCRDASSQGGSIGGARFNRGKCAKAPTSTLLTTNNGICNVSAYEGGLMCCGGGTFLLDADQRVPAPVDTWQLKYRFYFEEYRNQSNAYRVWWSTEATNNEYDCPKSTADCQDPSTNASLCTHVIRSEFRGRDMLKRGSGCMVSGDPAACIDPTVIAARDDGVFNLVYAAAHCHAPGCIALELWDEDRSELICRNEAKIGTNNSEHMNEEGFVVGIPPCVWGAAEDGLLPPPRIHLDSNLSTVKFTNNTFGHWGVMALWQMRAAYATIH